MLSVSTPKTNHLLRNRIYQQILKYPGKTDVQISKDLGLGVNQVKSQRDRIVKGIDFLLAKHMAEAFIQDYQMSIDAMKLQLGELEEEIDHIKEDMIHGWKDDEVPLNTLDKALLRRDILAIQKQKTDIWMKIVTQARQSEAIEVMNLIKKKVISIPESQKVALENDFE